MENNTKLVELIGRRIINTGKDYIKLDSGRILHLDKCEIE